MQANATPPSWLGVWEGTIGKHAVMVCLDRLPGRSAYFYETHKLEIALSEKDGVLVEMAKGELSGIWTLSEPQGDSMEGKWQAPQLQRRIPIQLKRISYSGSDAPCESRSYKSKLNDISSVSISKNNKAIPELGIDIKFEYVTPSGIRAQYVASFGNINGTQYRMITIDKTLVSFELIGADKITTIINDQLLNAIKNEIESSADCMGYMEDNGLGKGQYESITKPIFITEHWVSAKTHTYNYCGGNHPNEGEEYTTWNRETGKPEDIWTWFNTSGAQLIKKKMPSGEILNHIKIGSKLRNEFSIRWKKKGKDGCDNIGEDEYIDWKVFIGNDGLIFAPDLPQVIYACNDSIHIPYATLMPILNKYGKAAVASVQADLAH